MEEQQPQPESRTAGPVRPWSWPGSPPADVGLGGLFAGLAAWKSGAPRDAADPAAPAAGVGAAEDTAGEGGSADAATEHAAGDAATEASAGDAATEHAAGDAAAEHAAGDAAAMEDAAADAAAEDAAGEGGGGDTLTEGGAGESAPECVAAEVGGSMDWLAVAATAAEKALGEPAWRHGDDGLAAAMSLIGRLRCALERVEVAVAGEVVQRGSANANGCSTIDWLVAAAGSSAPRPEVHHVASVLRVAQGCSGQAPAGESFAQAFRSGAMPLAKAEQVAGFVSDVAAVAEPETLGR